MIRLSRSVKAVGGVLLAAVVIGFTNPKAVHAVAAALVQVTNTSSNPVVTQGVGPQAGNMVHLSCGLNMDKVNHTCYQNYTNGSQSLTGDYHVPVGESLVITAVDVFPVPLGGLCGGAYKITLSNGYGGIFLNVFAANSPVTAHFTYPSGVVIGPGIEPSVSGATETLGGEPLCGSEATVDIFGYLTAS